MLPAILTTLLWSCSAICAGRSAKLVGGPAANAARMAIATVLLALWAHLSPRAHGLGGPALPWFLASGFIGFGLGDVAMFAALQRIGPRLTMLLTHCLAAPIAALTTWLWLGEALGGWEILWVAVVLGGVALALAPDRGSEVSRRDFWIGVLGGLGSALGQGLGSVLSSKANYVAVSIGQPVDGGTATYQRIGIGLLVALGFYLVLRRTHPQPAPTPAVRRSATFWIVANALAGPCIGVACYQWGIASRELKLAVLMAIVATAPVATQFLAWTIDRIQPTRRTVFGGIVAVAGVVMLQLTMHKEPPTPIASPAPTPAANAPR